MSNDSKTPAPPAAIRGRGGRFHASPRCGRPGPPGVARREVGAGTPDAASSLRQPNGRGGIHSLSTCGTSPTHQRHAGTKAATGPNPAANLTRMLLWDPAVTDPAWFVALRWAAAAAVYLTLGIGAAWPPRPPRGRTNH